MDPLPKQLRHMLWKTREAQRRKRARSVFMPRTQRHPALPGREIVILKSGTKMPAVYIRRVRRDHRGREIKGRPTMPWRRIR